jgi:hypothetical protein
MIELEGRGFQENPDLEMEGWLEKLTEAKSMRSGYQDLAAKGLMTHEELGSKLKRLEETRTLGERELETLRRKSAWSGWSKT